LRGRRVSSALHRVLPMPDRSELHRPLLPQRDAAPGVQYRL
jgi:hypothetical protein